MLSRRLAVIVPTLLRLDVSLASMAAWPTGVDLRCVQGDSSDWAKRAVIVPAVYYEWAGMAVPAWLLADGRTVYRYQRLNARRPCYCANAGFEAGVYLSFIAAHYERLPAAVVFVQADWFDPPKGGKSPRGLEAPRFDFWQMRCAAHMHGAHAAGGAHLPQRRPWADYLPLGQRNGYWPPRVVTRSSLTYSRAVPLAHFGACLRHMQRLAGLAVPPPGGLNLTFYASSNFVASRRRLRS